MEVVGGVERVVACGFKRGEGGVEFAGGNFGGGGVDVAEFAGGEITFFGAHGWAEGSAEDGAMFVQVAGAVIGIENGAGFVVGEFFEEDGLVIVFGEDAGGNIAGEPWIEACEGGGDAGADALGAGGVGLGEEFKAFAQTGRVFVRDREDSNAALSAAGPADEVRVGRRA